MTPYLDAALTFRGDFTAPPSDAPRVMREAAAPHATGHPTEEALRRELMAFATPSTALGTTLYVLEYALYAAAIACVLWAPGLAWKVLASIVAGFELGKLSLFAHDAAHGSTTRSRSLNRFMAVAAMTPILYNYPLWAWDHHTMHHRYPNGDHPDAFVPFGKADFDALPAWRRALERLARSPLFVGFGVYFLIVRWYSTKLFPRDPVPQYVRPRAWKFFFGLVAYAIAWTTLLALAPLYSSTDSITAVVLGFVVPVFMFNTLFGSTLFLQHNHPKVPWFRGTVDRETMVRPAFVTPHLRTPRWLSAAMHGIFDHPVHHVNPRVPLYRAFEAQAYLNRRLAGAPIVVEPLSLAGVLRTIRTCKLYDYEQHRWLDFDGRPTTGTVPLMASEVASRRRDLP